MIARAIASLLAAVTWQNAAAQGSGPAAIEEVVVTATRVGETSLQDTPISMSVFSQQYLAEMVVSDIRDLAIMTPNLTMSSNTNMAQIYIRGVGSNNVFAGADPSSTVHHDGVYLARPQSNFANFADVERIEVLRGPQGTLYGRNSVGGTINVVSRRPSLSELRAEASVTVGNESFVRPEAYLSVPVIDDRLAFSLAGQISEHDPYRENVAPTGHDVDDEDIQTYRGQVLWKATDTIEVIARGDYYRDQSLLYSASSSPLVPPVQNAPLARSIVGDARKVALNAPSYIDRTADGGSVEVNAELGSAWTLKSLTAYRRNDNYIASDPDTTELDTVRTLLGEDQEQLSQEFNFVGKFDELTLFLGAYYLDEDIDSLLEVQARPTNRSTRIRPLVDTETWAVFGQAQYGVTPTVTLNIGGRYSEETKDWVKQYHGTFVTDTGEQLTDLNLPPERGHYSRFTPKFGIEYRPIEDVLAYATVSRGFKSGGFNITATVPGGYEPEDLWAYELGLNTAHLDGRLTSRLSAFYYDYEDLQVQAFILPGVASITNAATAEITGGEAELTAQATDNLQFRVSVGYLDATYGDYREAPIGGGVVIDASGNRLNNAPEWSASGMAEYLTEHDWGSLRFRLEYGWQSEVFFTVANTQLFSQGSYGLLNASVGYESPSGRFGVSLWGRNLTDEEYLTGAGAIVTPAGHYGPIMTYGLQLSVRN